MRRTHSLYIPAQVTQRVDVAAMERMVTSQTAMLVGSAPQFAHGCIDPIKEIAQLGIKVGTKFYYYALLKISGLSKVLGTQNSWDTNSLGGIQKTQSNDSGVI